MGKSYGSILALFAAATAALATSGRGGEKIEGREQFVVLIEPKLLATKLFRSIPGAKTTVFVPGRETEYGGLEYYDDENFKKLELEWEAFFERARESSDRLVEILEPEYVRDHAEVIQYAILRSKNQRTAGVILGEKFREKFRKTIGDELVVLIPDRNSVFVFPKLAGGYGEFGETMIEWYDDAVYPVSLEVFEVSGKGVRVIGSFSRR